jgi:MFS family permease
VYCIIIPVLPLFVEKHLHGSSFATGLLFACYAMGLLGATPLAAWWSDRTASRSVPMVAGLSAMIGSSLLFGVATELWQLCLARLAQGISAAVSNCIGLAMLADVFPSTKLPEAMAMAMAVTGLGGLAGPPLGGALYQHVSYASVFMVCGGMAAFDLLLRVLLIDDAWMRRQRERIKRQALADELAADEEAAAEAAETALAVDPPSTLVVLDAVSPVVADVAAGSSAVAAPAPSVLMTTARVHHVTVMPAEESPSLLVGDTSTSPGGVVSSSTGSNDAVAHPPTPHHQPITLWGLLQVRELQVTFVSVTVLSTVFTGLEPLLSLHFDESYGSSSTMIGLSYFAIGVPYSLAAMVVAPLQEKGTNPKLIVGTGLVLLTVALATLPLPRSLPVALAPMCLFGLGIGAAMSPPLGEVGAWLTRTRNQASFAQGFALFNLTYAVGMFAGPLLSGVLDDHAGFTVTMIVMASMCAATAVLLLMIGAAEVKAAARARTHKERMSNKCKENDSKLHKGTSSMEAQSEYHALENNA